MRVGLFHCKAMCKQKHRISLLEAFCIYIIFFTSKKLSAFQIVLNIYFFATVPTSKPNFTTCTDFREFECGVKYPSVSNSAHTHSLSSMIFYIMVVIAILLVLGGIEVNPGPEYDDSGLHVSLDESSFTSKICDMFSSSVSFMHLNIQSIVPKLEMIAAEYENFDILSFSETWLNDSHTYDTIKLLNYQKPFRRDRGGEKMGGGVIVYVKENLSVVRRPDLEDDELEGIWLQLKLNGKKILYASFYIPPNSSNEVWSKLENSLEKATDDNSIDYILVTGDFNNNQLDPTKTKIKSLLSEFSLLQVIDEPTHFTEHSSSLLDLIITNNVNSLLYSGVGPPLLDQIRYHCPVIGFLNCPKVHPKAFKRKVWKYDEGDYDAFRLKLRNVDWDTFFHLENIDSITDGITKSILDAAEATIPNKIVTVRKGGPLWLTGDIRRLIRSKNRVHRKAKKFNRPSDWAKFRKIRNSVTSMVRKAKEDHDENLIKKLVNENPSSAKWWHTVNQISGIKGTEHSIPPLIKDDTVLFDDFEKSSEFNSYFAGQSKVNDAGKALPNFTPHTEQKIESIILNESEVEDVLSILNSSKASGPDLVSPRVLKEGASVLKYPLCKLFNQSLTTSIYPSSWKKANVIPVYKNNKPNEVKNYRPISLLSIISKCMERCVYKHVHNYLLLNNLLTKNQSGFTKGDSAVNQLVDITNDFGKALDSGKEIRVIFCDISKAFDRVWHKGLLFKLKQLGISGNLLNWFENYLTGRVQRVVLNGSNSDWLPIEAGVPQGSILGPLLFLIFINDIVDEINSVIKLFADDTSLYLVVNKPDEAATILNTDLEKISSWASMWLVTFNPQKTESLVISRKQYKPIHPPLLMNNQQIQTVNSHKHLGVTIANDGSWHGHIEHIISKAYKRLNIMRKLKFIVNRFTLEKLFISFIRPILEYADVIWDTKNLGLINRLETVQLEAARIVTGGTKLTSHHKLYDETKWEKLTDRRKNHRLFLFHKMVNGETPQYLSNLIPNTIGRVHDHNTRQINNIQEIRTRTNFYSDYFLPSTIKDWNRLSINTRNTESFASFKNQLSNQNTKVPPYFYSGCRLGQILHTRLRMNCSSLNEHLFLKNIVESPRCVCGEIETVQHFIFHCKRYSNIRQNMIDSIHNCNMNIIVDKNLLIFGSENLTDEQNATVFRIFQKYILQSKRF